MARVRKSGPSVLLILGVLIIAPFAFVFEKTGWPGLLLVVGILGFGGYKLMQKANEGKDDEYNELILKVLKVQLRPSEAQQIYGQLIRSAPTKGQLFRHTQMLGESLNLALNSKNRDTAESRMKFAEENYFKIKSLFASAAREGTLAEIEKTFAESKTNFHTNLYINVAAGYVEKAKKLKSEKAREKYFLLASQVLQEGRNDPYSNKAVLDQKLKETESLKG